MAEESPMKKLEEILRGQEGSSSEERSLFEAFRGKAEGGAFAPPPQPAEPGPAESRVAPPSPQAPSVSEPAGEVLQRPEPSPPASQELRQRIEQLEQKLERAQAQALAATARLQEREAAHKDMEAMFQALRAQQRSEELYQAERERAAQLQARVQALEEHLSQQYAQLQSTWSATVEQITERAGQGAQAVQLEYWRQAWQAHSEVLELSQMREALREWGQRFERLHSEWEGQARQIRLELAGFRETLALRTSHPDPELKAWEAEFRDQSFKNLQSQLGVLRDFAQGAWKEIAARLEEAARRQAAWLEQALGSWAAQESRASELAQRAQELLSRVESRLRELEDKLRVESREP